MITALKQWGLTGVFQVDFSFNVLNGAGAPDFVPLRFDVSFGA